MTSPEQSAERIYNILNEALSEDPARRKQAEQQLCLAEDHQDFFASLVQIATAPDEHASPFVRWLAALCGKNAVSRSWRRRSNPNAVNDDERQFVISVLLDSLGEKHSKIATQLSVWIATVARADFPRHWKSAIPDICERITSQHHNVMKHALSTLDMTLKTLMSLRLRHDRIALYPYGPPTFNILFRIFCDNFDKLVALESNPQQQASSEAFILVVICMKSMRRIIEKLCKQLSDIKELSPFLAKIAQQPNYFMRGAPGGNEVQLRLSLLAAKLIRASQGTHPIDFQIYLSTFLPLYYDTIISFSANVSDERSCLHSATFLKNLLTAPNYKLDLATLPNHHVPVPSGNSAEGCRAILISFFTVDRINVLIEAMIGKIFVLTSSELESWANDPEALVRDDDEGLWGMSMLRRECEDLFSFLLIRDKLRLSAYVVNLANSVSKDQPLLLDACYRAVGQAAQETHGAFDFETWLNGPLGSILKSTVGSDLGDRIIQARAAWLCGQFSDRMKHESRLSVYPLLVSLMSKLDYDRVIVLTAATAVRALVDDHIGFKGADFVPYLEACIQSCIKLICHSSSVETKRDLFGTISILVAACETEQIAPVAEILVTTIPIIWEEVGKGDDRREKKTSETPGYSSSSNGDVLLRTDIVILLTKLVEKTGSLTLKSEAMRQILMAVVAYSVDADRCNGNIGMVTDGCDFWLVLVQASEEYSDDLHKLFVAVEKILGNDFDNLGQICKIMQEYMLLGKEVFMREYAGMVVKTIHSAIKSVIDRGLLASSEVVDLILRMYPQSGVQVCAEVLVFMLERVCGKTESTVVNAAYVSVLARAVLSNVEAVENVVFKRDERTCVDMMDAIMEAMDSLGRVERKKMAVMALCGLAGRHCASEMVRKRVVDVINSVVHVVSEEHGLADRRKRKVERSEFEERLTREGEAMADSEREHLTGRRMSGADLSGVLRRKAVENGDVLLSMRVEQCCKQMLVKLQALGQDVYAEVLRTSRSTVLQQLESLL